MHYKYLKISDIASDMLISLTNSELLLQICICDQVINAIAFYSGLINVINNAANMICKLFNQMICLLIHNGATNFGIRRHIK